MKQSALWRWIEAAEARSVCLIAEEDDVDRPDTDQSASL